MSLRNIIFIIIITINDYFAIIKSTSAAGHRPQLLRDTVTMCVSSECIFFFLQSFFRRYFELGDYYLFYMNIITNFTIVFVYIDIKKYSLHKIVKLLYLDAGKLIREVESRTAIRDILIRGLEQWTPSFMDTQHDEITDQVQEHPVMSKTPSCTFHTYFKQAKLYDRL